jgi:hypothetical protein
MSTNATLEFVDSNKCKCYVYKHWDGSPSGIKEAIFKALRFSWLLPRFEADEFAASFIAANKVGPGDVRVIGKLKDYSGDYHYAISHSVDIWIKAYSLDFKDGKRTLIYDGSFREWNPID